MNALKADLSVPYNERIGPLPALQRCSTGTPLQKSKLAVEEFIEASQYSHPVESTAISYATTARLHDRKGRRCR